MRVTQSRGLLSGRFERPRNRVASRKIRVERPIRRRRRYLRLIAVSAFPDELYQAPRSWTEQAYPKLIYYNDVDKGGHFAA